MVTGSAGAEYLAQSSKAITSEWGVVANGHKHENTNSKQIDAVAAAALTHISALQRRPTSTT